MKCAHTANFRSNTQDERERFICAQMKSLLHFVFCERSESKGLCRMIDLIKLMFKA